MKTTNSNEVKETPLHSPLTSYHNSLHTPSSSSIYFGCLQHPHIIYSAHSFISNTTPFTSLLFYLNIIRLNNTHNFAKFKIYFQIPSNKSNIYFIDNYKILHKNQLKKHLYFPHKRFSLLLVQKKTYISHTFFSDS